MNKYLFMIIFSCFFMQLGAVEVSGDQYIRYVDSIEYTTSMGSTLAKITLSDGTAWKFYTECDQDKALFYFQQSMQPGNEVLVDTNYGTIDYRIGVGDGWTYLIYVDVATLLIKESFPKVENIESICTKKAGWFSFAEYDYYIYLSDGSIWKTTSEPNVVVGDTILVSRKSFDDLNYWNFINLDGKLEYLKSINYILDLRKTTSVTPLNVIFG